MVDKVSKISLFSPLYNIFGSIFFFLFMAHVSALDSMDVFVKIQ